MPEEPTPTEPDTSEPRAVVEEETALKQVPGELARARDIPAALQRIAELSRTAGGAEASYLERIHLARQEVEVVATAGEPAPVVGVCVPFPGVARPSGRALGREPARLLGGDLAATSEPWGGSEFFLWPASSARVSPSDSHDLPSRRTMGAVGPAMLAAGKEIMTTFVERLRHDPGLSAAADLPVALAMVIRTLASAERTSCRVLRHTGR